MKRSALTQLQWMDRLSPRICRLIARRPGRGPQPPLTNREIADASTIAFWRVCQMSKLDSWATCTCWERQQFMLGCGITDERAARQYVVRQAKNRVAMPHLWKTGMSPKYRNHLLGQGKPKGVPAAGRSKQRTLSSETS